MIQVWDKTVKYINDPATHEDAVKIMSNRVGVDLKQYEQFIGGRIYSIWQPIKPPLRKVQVLTLFMAQATT